jgi:hypothetical protein
MFTRAISVGFVLLVIGVLASAGWATPIPIDMMAADFNDLLGGSARALDTPLVTPMAAGNMVSVVTSQAFTDDAGTWLYLYQVANTGGAKKNAVEMFTASPFLGLSENTVLGYLTANVPAGFVLGNQLPTGASVDPDAGPTVSFGFPSWMGKAIAPGKSSSTLFVITNHEPGLIQGNVIDGAIATGQVVGPVPEPTSLLLLGGGAAMLLWRRTRRRALSNR